MQGNFESLKNNYTVNILTIFCDINILISDKFEKYGNNIITVIFTQIYERFI